MPSPVGPLHAKGSAFQIHFRSYFPYFRLDLNGTLPSICTVPRSPGCALQQALTEIWALRRSRRRIDDKIKVQDQLRGHLL